jgi:4-aminobutyrate aminotransferase-like enzyme
MIGAEIIDHDGRPNPTLTSTLASKCLDNGLILGTSMHGGLGNVLKFKPPAVITDEEIDKAISIFEKACGGF